MILGLGDAAPNFSILDDAILYAAQMGANVIQMSLSGPETQAISDAIATAHETYGCFVDCASGNSNTPIVSYPARARYVFAVGATDTNDTRWWLSNYGDSLDVVAPGDSIWSTQLNDSYGYGSGTSFAAPHVAGIAGLIWSYDSTFTNTDIEKIIARTADKVGGYSYDQIRQYGAWDDSMGYGRVNAHDAITSIKSGPIASNETWSNWALVIGDVTVQSGVTLSISPGTRVEFATTDNQCSGEDPSKCELTVYGTLYVWGAVNDSVVFTSNAFSPSEGNWYGIVFKDSTSESSQLRFSQIKYAHKGVCCKRSSIGVDRTTISNCDYGAYVDTAKSKLFMHYVTCDNCSYGVRVQEGKAHLWLCDLEHNDIGIGYFSAEHYFPGGPSRQADIKSCDVKYNTKGIFVDDCSPIINHCRIDSNSLWGIKCVNDSDPILGRDTLTYNGVGAKSINMPGSMKSEPPPQEHKGGLSCLGTSCPIVCTGPVSGSYVRGRNVIKDNNGRGVY